MTVKEITVFINPLHNQKQIMFIQNSASEREYGVVLDENNTIILDEKISSSTYDLNVISSSGPAWLIDINNSVTQTVDVMYTTLTHKVEFIKQNSDIENESTVGFRIEFNEGEIIQRVLNVHTKPTQSPSTLGKEIVPIHYLLL